MSQQYLANMLAGLAIQSADAAARLAYASRNLQSLQSSLAAERAYWKKYVAGLSALRSPKSAH